MEHELHTLWIKDNTKHGQIQIKINEDYIKKPETSMTSVNKDRMAQKVPLEDGEPSKNLRALVDSIFKNLQRLVNEN